MGDTPIWAWTTFGVLLALLLVVDLFAHRGEHGSSHRAAVIWSIVWVAVGLGFGAFVWRVQGGIAAQEYYGAYLIEKSLSVDNLFVFLLVFQTLRIPHKDEHRVLIWGILGALVLRAVFIGIGISALERISWLIPCSPPSFQAWCVSREDPQAGGVRRRVAAMHLPVTAAAPAIASSGRACRRRLPALVALRRLTSCSGSTRSRRAPRFRRSVVYSSNAFAIPKVRAYTVPRSSCAR
jgi:tellurite resistance protein TerC